MRIASFQLSNYKSFREPQELRFSSGFNVLVGQNNIGKTALLEALSLQFPAKPHKSLVSLPRITSPVNPASRAKVSLTVSGAELKDLLLTIGSFNLPVPSSLTSPQANNAMETLEKMVKEKEITFTLGLLADQNNSANWRVNEFPSHALYKPHPLDSSQHGLFFSISTSQDKTEFTCPGVARADVSNDFGVVVAHYLRSRIYSFRAERFNVSMCAFGTNSTLTPNATNLPEVLDVLQGSNPARFSRLNGFLKEIFPSIYQISVVNRANHQLEIIAWTEDPSSEREDLAIPLSECGTGVGQALAILYVILTSDFPRTILIDEPNSFLHPAAARKLIEILRVSFSQHQYIVSTHSPEIIRTANPNTLSLIKWDNRQSVVENLDTSKVTEVQRCLVEVGARLSDVFGADQVLWVEGSTEEECYRLIIERLGDHPALGISIVSVRNTGDFEGKRPSSRVIWEIYSKLSKGNALIPPAVGFVFDREGRTQHEMDDLNKRSGGRVRFLPCRMYENYLISLEALEAVIADLPSFRDSPIAKDQIEEWLKRNGCKREYLASSDGDLRIGDKTWLKEVHGAKFLANLFSDLSGNKEEYRKTVHSVQLTDWLIKNKREMLEELKEFLLACLKET